MIDQTSAGLAAETGFRDFPDLNNLDSRPNNLPLQATEFLGRGQELAAIHLTLRAGSRRGSRSRDGTKRVTSPNPTRGATA